MDGALLLDKHAGISSFGAIQALKQELSLKTGIKKKHLPKIGHSGTLDPFATGLLVILIGKAVKLAEYFLHSIKTYEATLRFGERTLSGDLTNPIYETCQTIPQSIEILKKNAWSFTQSPYLQIPPMYSAKKIAGKPLYELARKGIEIGRPPKHCRIYCFEILDYRAPELDFHATCSPGTFIRTLAEDFATQLGSLAHLRSLCRHFSGAFSLKNAWPLSKIKNSTSSLDTLPCWIDFNKLLNNYPYLEITESEKQAFICGKKEMISRIINKKMINKNMFNNSENNQELLIVYCQWKLIAILKKINSTFSHEKDQIQWKIERVFP